jgi:protein-tyrosine phosphatase
MGASRSASVVIHYIMKYGVSYEQALYIVKRGRPVVNLTEKFQNTLKGSMKTIQI